ncbi:hypothetical protein QNS97_000758 [Listeria monocytogenes]|uniref:hypothetical protein n=1 Tax=Listeria monocytogenes TaxID=1639 RepID=UPI0010E20335|nr:hypothetical protein [Listeria monocytogenes]EAC8723230.1 hypothetical protein [Listeria monocytogenes]EAD2073910.1 hypothetical protein [Listeria monocytogenes]EAD6241441.1 hypothetical protein [Listeria monocytogenes]EAG9619667.1 hypothetical protein [Listeria monocytogenes]EAH2392466.1 hypothetical protein [Listeria monocytogenes]
MKKLLLLAGLLIVFSFGLTACGNSSDSAKEESKEESTSTANESEGLTEEAPAEEEESDSGIIDSEDYATSWSDDWKGLQTKISSVSVFKVDSAKLAEDGEDGEGLIVVNYELNNNSEIDFNTYPDQGVLVADGKQIDASMINSDDLGGELMQGVNKNGAVVYILPTLNDVSDIKEIRLTWSANYETDNYEEDSFKDYDARITLK